MDNPLKLTVIMNSAVETILAAKCCAIPDANLEIILTNTGETTITVTGRFSLEGDSDCHALHLYPQGTRAIAAGDCAAFYGSLDANHWPTGLTLAITDTSGRRYRFELGSQSD